MEAEANKNQKYAGQVADICRTSMRISFKDLIKKVTGADNVPYLNIFSPRSIYLITLFDFPSSSSLVANLPIADMPLITARTIRATSRIFDALNSPDTPIQNEEAQDQETPVVIAFTPLKTGTYAGKTPGDLLLATENADELLKNLNKQIAFLEKRLADFPQNKSQIDAIKEAIDLFSLGILKDSKPTVNPSTPSISVGKTLEIYKVPVKHQKSKDPTGKLNKCYSMEITCSPARQYPYRLSIMNCFAPLGTAKNGMKPILMDKAQEIKKNSIDLTEGEWLGIIDALNENTKNARKLWYSEMRSLDELNREYH